jgi:hypothetical protein
MVCDFFLQFCGKSAHVYRYKVIDFHQCAHLKVVGENFCEVFGFLEPFLLRVFDVSGWGAPRSGFGGHEGSRWGFFGRFISRDHGKTISVRLFIAVSNAEPGTPSRGVVTVSSGFAVNPKVIFFLRGIMAVEPQRPPGRTQYRLGFVGTIAWVLRVLAC